MAPLKSAEPLLAAGTRASALARTQTRLIAAALAVGPRPRAIREVVITTAGDRDQETPLPALEGRGVFTEALERELRSGAIDFAVHSLKDLPLESPPDLVIAAVGRRDDPRDVLISASGYTLSTLPAGARVGTCSSRRGAQILARRPDLQLVSLRGNVDTRVRRALARDYDAIVIAAAGVLRLGLGSAISQFLPLDAVLPAPGQGALAIQCRAGDRAVRSRLAELDEPDVRAATDAERAFLEGLGGGCLAPIAAHGRVAAGRLELEGVVAAPDGARQVRVRGAGPATGGRALGLHLAADAIARGALELIG